MVKILKSLKINPRWPKYSKTYKNMFLNRLEWVWMGFESLEKISQKNVTKILWIDSVWGGGRMDNLNVLPEKYPRTSRKIQKNLLIFFWWILGEFPSPLSKNQADFQAIQADFGVKNCISKKKKVLSCVPRNLTEKITAPPLSRKQEFLDIQCS